MQRSECDRWQTRHAHEKQAVGRNLHCTEAPESTAQDHVLIRPQSLRKISIYSPDAGQGG